MRTVDINLLDKICTNCLDHVKDTTLNSLTENQRISLFNDNTLIIKSIYDDYITFCIEDGTCNIIRNCALNGSIPICLTCQNIKISVKNITQ